MLLPIFERRRPASSPNLPVHHLHPPHRRLGQRSLDTVPRRNITAVSHIIPHESTSTRLGHGAVTEQTRRETAGKPSNSSKDGSGRPTYVTRVVDFPFSSSGLRSKNERPGSESCENRRVQRDRRQVCDSFMLFVDRFATPPCTRRARERIQYTDVFLVVKAENREHGR